MPLARATLRNEFGLGSSDLYREPSRLEDPKAILDGVAVSGLIGLLRNLGDLVEFAADVFLELQEQVAATSSRSRRLLARVQVIEASLPPLEKAVFSQKSHIHFAYVAGCDWHPRMRKQKHIFVGDELPKFIMDSYEECRFPPRLDRLDKFDEGGPGSCLKRYSDPSFHRRLSNGEQKKSRKSKKKRSIRRHRDSCSSSTSRLSESPFLNDEAINDAVSHVPFPLYNQAILNRETPNEERSVPETQIQHDAESSGFDYRLHTADAEQEEYVDALNNIDSESEPDPVLLPPTLNPVLDPGTLSLAPETPPHSPPRISESPPNTCEPEIPSRLPPQFDEPTQSTCDPAEAMSSTEQDVPTASPPVAIWTNGGLLGLEPSKPPDHAKPNSVEVSRTFGSSFRCIDERETEKPNGLRRTQSLGCDTRRASGSSPSCSPPLERIKISFNPSCGVSLKLKFPDGDRPNGSMLFASFQLVPDGKPGPVPVSDSDDDVFCTSSLYTSDGRNQSDVESEPWEFEERAKDDDKDASVKPTLPDDPCLEEEKTATKTKDEENFDFLKQIRDKSFSLKRSVTMPAGQLSAPSSDTVAAILKKADAIRKAVEIRDEEDDDSTWSDS